MKQIKIEKETIKNLRMEKSYQFMEREGYHRISLDTSVSFKNYKTSISVVKTYSTLILDITKI